MLSSLPSEFGALNPVRISGTGHCLPERVVSNQDLVAFIETSDAFIRERTGVLERRHVETEHSLSDLAVAAAERAMADAGVGPSGIDMLIVNTLSPDYHDPSQACLLQPLLGLGTIPALDIRAQCSGALYGLELARHLVSGGVYRRILVICAEILSKRLDPSREGRNLAVLLSDGAGAFVVEPAAQRDGEQLLDLLVGADGTQFELLATQSPGSRGTSFIDAAEVAEGKHFFRMKGGEMFVDAVARLCQASRAILARNHLSVDDLGLVIPHQPNRRILDAVIEELAMPRERMFVTVERLGNMASAAFPVALDLARREGAIDPDRPTLFVTYGSGATWGAALYGRPVG
jgi:3-oxoacyl-(acyl-carrier-protein) synthase III